MEKRAFGEIFLSYPGEGSDSEGEEKRRKGGSGRENEKGSESPPRHLPSSLRFSIGGESEEEKGESNGEGEKKAKAKKEVISLLSDDEEQRERRREEQEEIEIEKEMVLGGKDNDLYLRKRRYFAPLFEDTSSPSPSSSSQEAEALPPPGSRNTHLTGPLNELLQKAKVTKDPWRVIFIFIFFTFAFSI